MQRAHVIIELKRASVKPRPYELAEQGRSYVKALKVQLDPTESSIAQVEVIFVLGQALNEEAETLNHLMNSVSLGWRTVTYNTLATGARMAYDELLKTTETADVLVALLEEEREPQRISPD